MDFGTGGYVLVRLPEVITIAGADTEKIIEVGRETIAKLTQWEKPVLFEHFTILHDGAPLEMLGYSLHGGSGDAHSHVLGFVTILIISDTQVKVSLAG